MLSIGFIFNLCLFYNYFGFILSLFLNLSPLVLKTVENLGVSYVKGTEQYQSKLEAELRKLKFSYRVSNRKAWRDNGPFRLYGLIECKLWERSFIRHRVL